MSRRLLLFLFVLVLLLFPGAAESARETRRNYTCWDLRGESYPDIPDQEVESPLPPDAYPVAGIVSHHLLAGELIDAWFAELARHSRISRFFILSPAIGTSVPVTTPLPTKAGKPPPPRFTQMWR